MGMSRKRVYEMNLAAAKFFRENLFDKEVGAEAMNYLETEAPYVLENCRDSELLRQIRRVEGIAAPKEF